jgi:hypothetical protein
MPQVQIQTPDGQNYKIDSSDPELIGRWFTELLARESQQFHHYDQFIMRIWPIYIPTPDGRGTADWCANSIHRDCHDMQFPASLDGLISNLIDMREKQHKS